MQGDVVLYKQGDEPAHVAVVLMVARPHPTSATLDIKVLSKWGLEAEFIHFAEDVPYWLGRPLEYYTERPAV
jgi:hypothetical protein